MMTRRFLFACFALWAIADGPADHLQQGYGGPPKLHAKAEAGLYVRAVSAQGVNEAGWPIHGGVDNIRYSPLTQINRDNVSKLQVSWTYDSHDAFKGSEMQSNPVVVDGVL